MTDIFFPVFLLIVLSKMHIYLLFAYYIYLSGKAHSCLIQLSAGYLRCPLPTSSTL